MAALIEDYGLIGDTHGAALVSKSADIDWLCVPRFDSEALLFKPHSGTSSAPTGIPSC